MSLEETIARVVEDTVRRVVREELQAQRGSEEAVSKEEAARRLHVSERTIRRRIAAGILPAIDLGGGVIRIPLSAVLPKAS
jgi:excisionase family DNA binding protein